MAKKTIYKCERVDCAMWNSRMVNKCDALEDAFKGECPFYKSDAQMGEELKALKAREMCDSDFATLRKRYRG